MRALILTVASLMLLIPHRLPAGEEGPVLLRYKHPPGQQTVYKIKRRIDLEMDKLKCQALFEHKCVERLKEVARSRGNIFAELMETVKSCSLGQISHALYRVGGEYRRNM